MNDSLLQAPSFSNGSFVEPKAQRESSLEAILRPTTIEDFLLNYYGKGILHVPGDPAKFADLLPWSVLNGILDHQALDLQMTLVKEGHILPVESYRAGRRLLAHRVTTLLREGATLIINHIDEKYGPIGALAQNLERTLNCRVGVNMYAAWRSSRGFDLHSDDHDVFILQVAGKKNWQIHGESIRFPVDTSGFRSNPPTKGPIWQSCLGPGDLLHIPRGWWHVALPCDVPTIHLTVGIYSPTALSLLTWLTNRLKSREMMRMDIPRIADAETKARYMTAVQELVSEALSEIDLLGTFLRESNAMAQTRPAFGLPWSAMPNVIPASDSCNIIFVPRQLDMQLNSGTGTVSVFALGSEFTFKAEAKEFIHWVFKNAPITLREFYKAFAGVTADQELAIFLVDAVTSGIIVLREPS